MDGSNKSAIPETTETNLTRKRLEVSRHTKNSQSGVDLTVGETRRSDDVSRNGQEASVTGEVYFVGGTV